jgi:hypothetical protein
MTDSKPSQQAMDRAKLLLNCHSPLRSGRPADIEYIAVLLDRFAAQARLEEARWWKQNCAWSTKHEAMIQGERIATLERSAKEAGGDRENVES